MKRTTKTMLLIRTLALTTAFIAVACATSGTALVDEPTPVRPEEDASRPVEASLDRDASVPDVAVDATTCEAPCGLAPQCGCAKSETCDLNETGARVCVGAGTGRAGLACLSTRECATGLVCANGVCRAPCSGASAACPLSRTCSDYPRSAVDGGPSAVTYSACPVPCAYDKEDSCGFAPGDLIASACVYQPASNSVECQKVKTAQVQSGVCNADAECGAGRVCVPSVDFSSCRRLCKPGDGKACGGCGPFTPPRVVDGTAYGFCPP